MRNIILIAPPAAGKGTQSKLIAEKYHIPHISTGDLLRNAIQKNTELAFIKEQISVGKLVDDDIIFELLNQRINEPDCSNGYILDGFPRNIAQANRYLNMLKEQNKPLGDVIYLDLSKETAKKRIVGRLSCPTCGAVYNDQFEDSKPLRFGTCNNCQGALTRRSDDSEAIFDQRYETFLKETYPLIYFFEKEGLLFRIGSGISKERTFAEIDKVITRDD